MVILLAFHVPQFTNVIYHIYNLIPYLSMLFICDHVYGELYRTYCANMCCIVSILHPYRHHIFIHEKLVCGLYMFFSDIIPPFGLAPGSKGLLPHAEVGVM